MSNSLPSRCLVCNWLFELGLKSSVEHEYRCTECSISSIRSNSAVPVYTSLGERKLCDQHSANNCSVCGSSYTDYAAAKKECEEWICTRQMDEKPILVALLDKVKKMETEGTSLKVMSPIASKEVSSSALTPLPSLIDQLRSRIFQVYSTEWRQFLCRTCCLGADNR